MKKTNKKVSVIIPAHNSEHFLKEAIDSVLSQTYKNLEIIIVDDGSTDNTRAIAEIYSDKIQYFYIKHSGVSTARNYGIKKASGEYIAFLDADDIWEKNKIEKQILIITKNCDYGIIATNISYINLAGEKIGGFDFSKIYPEGSNNLKNLLKNFFLLTSSLLIRYDIISKAGSFNPNLKMAEDIDFIAKILNKTELYILHEALVRYRRNNQKSLGSHLSSYSNREKVLYNCIKKYSLSDDYNFIHESFYNLYKDWGIHLLWEGNCKEARAKLCSALKNKFSKKIVFFIIKSYIKEIVLKIKL